MGQAKLLFELQQIDSDIESRKQALLTVESKLGDSEALNEAMALLVGEEKYLAEMKNEQRSAEWEIDDLETKIKAGEEQLYGGKIKNPKELSSLQKELEGLHSRKSNRENRVLELMEQVEAAQARLIASRSRVRQMKVDWRKEQERLTAEQADLKKTAVTLEENRAALLPRINPPDQQLYNNLKGRWCVAAVKIERGRCQGCRITLSVSELQRAKAGNLMQCSNCGRLLYLG